MRPFARKKLVTVLGILAIAGLAQILLESSAEARAGGGRSGGFRGSRSLRAPARPPQPAAPAEPRREALPAAQQPTAMTPQPGGFMRTFGTAMLGGFLGSMLFSGLANAAGFGGLGGSGFGLIELLLIGGLGFFLFRRLRATAGAGFGSGGSYGAQYHEPAGRDSSMPSESVPRSAPFYDQIDYRSLKTMDSSFDSERFLKTAQDIFFKVQSAWNRQDTAALRALCGAELMKTWEQELAALSARGHRNKMENIALRESEISEAWTENGEDYITVRLRANLLDYTSDIRTGATVSGNDSEPVEFEEYWTYSRPVGPNAWKVTAVQQV